MAFQKFTKPERVEVLPGQRVSAAMQKVGKTNMSDLTDEEREQIRKELDKQNKA